MEDWTELLAPVASSRLSIDIVENFRSAGAGGGGGGDGGDGETGSPVSNTASREYER